MSRIILLEEDDIIYRTSSETLIEEQIILRVPLPYARITHPMFGGNKQVAYLRVLQYALFQHQCVDVIYSKVYLDKDQINKEYFSRYNELLIDESKGKSGLYRPPEH